MSSVHNGTAVRWRRVMVLVLAAAVFGGAVAGLYGYRRHQQAAATADERAAGVAAYAAGNMDAAVVKLGAYLRHVPAPDREALYDFARARLKVSEPRNEHLVSAMTVLRRLVKRDLDYKDAAERLAQLHLLSGHNTQALDLAERYLKLYPRNTAMLQTRAMALAQLSRNTAALSAVRRALARDATSLRMQLLHLRLQAQAGTAPEKLLAEAQALLKKTPHDARFELVLAYAQSLNGDSRQAGRWLEQAARDAPAQTRLVRQLVTFLDQAQLFRQSLELLERTADATGDKALARRLTIRLFDDGDYAAVVKRLDKVDGQAQAADSELLGIKAISLRQLGMVKQADQVIATLAGRGNRAAARAWTGLLKALGRTGPGQSTRLVKACAAAIEAVPNETYFHAYLANAYAALGEDQLAIDQWARAGVLRPTWATPHVRAARTMLGMGGEARAALQQATAGFRRLPTKLPPALVYLRARAVNLAAGARAIPRELVALMAKLEAASGRDANLLESRVILLAKTGRTTAAAAAIQRALGWKPALSAAAMQALAGLSAQYKLGVAATCRAAIVRVHGMTAEVALARARALAQAGQAKAGLAMLAKAQRAAGGKAAGPWRLAWARYLDAIGDARAKAAWKQLAADYPKNISIVQAALDSTALSGERAFAATLIERMRQLSGERGLGWRIEKARWLLGGAKVKPGAAEAISLLQKVAGAAPWRIEPHVLLAQAHEMLGQLPLAVRALETATVLRPESVTIRLRLARDQQRLGNFDDARANLKRVSDSAAATAQQLQRTAAYLANQGDGALAIEVLKRARRAPKADAGKVLVLLASLYVQQGQKDKAAAVCAQILKHPTGQGLVFAGRFYASAGQKEKTRQVIAGLAKLKLAPGHAAMLRGQYYASGGENAKATMAFEQAVTQAPDDRAVWHAAVLFELNVGRAKQAIETARQASKRLGDDAGAKALVDHAGLVEALANSQFRPLVAAMFEQPKDRATAVKALKLLDAARRGRGTSEVAARMTALADGRPSFLTLQMAAAMVDLGRNQVAEAARIAKRAMNGFPTAVGPAKLAAQAAARMNQWNEALVAARQWGKRTTGRALEAETMIARAQLRLNMASAAVRTLRGYMQRALAKPGAHFAPISIYSEALIDDGRADKAAGLLRPLLLDTSSRWRLLWLQLATFAVGDVNVAGEWLSRVGPLIPQDALAERIALAQSWWTLATRTDRAAFRRRARQVIAAVVAHADAPAQAWFLRGVMAEVDHDPDTAAASYRRAIEADGALAAAKNNLAMVLTHEHEKVDEALKLARAAVGASPRNANYLDTLAQVEAAAKDYRQAIKTIRQAIELEPNNPQWRDRLASIKRQSQPVEMGRR